MTAREKAVAWAAYQAGWDDSHDHYEPPMGPASEPPRTPTDGFKRFLSRQQGRPTAVPKERFFRPW